MNDVEGFPFGLRRQHGVDDLADSFRVLRCTFHGDRTSTPGLEVVGPSVWRAL